MFRFYGLLKVKLKLLLFSAYSIIQYDGKGGNYRCM